MQETGSNIASGQRLDVCIFEQEIQEMQDVLARSMPSFYRRAYRYLGNAADAEDAVQDALLSACRHLGQFKGRSKMSTWLTTIVINAALTKLRRRRGQIHTPLDERFRDEEQGYSLSERLADGKPGPEADYMKSELFGHLTRHVAKLPPSLRRAFQLRELDGMTISEAAHILGVSDVTVRAQVSRARAKLRRMIGQELNAHRSRLVLRANSDSACGIKATADC
ncbi:RNA polymerase sigma factor [Edaphobacter aggregans]|uniref:RNA polymerase sigma factor n=1 Tax=Edaphobacter aggregans TaxID=570835 RepID=UPI00068BD56B|nr:sigma-70 family RNA polymerase sigma factor [Edaphobacter aggregans]